MWGLKGLWAQIGVCGDIHAFHVSIKTHLTFKHSHIYTHSVYAYFAHEIGGFRVSVLV